MHSLSRPTGSFRITTNRGKTCEYTLKGRVARNFQRLATLSKVFTPVAYRRARVIANEPPSREFKKLIRELVPEEICLRLGYRRGSTFVDQLSRRRVHEFTFSVLMEIPLDTEKKYIYYGEEIKLTFFFSSFQLWRKEKYVERDNFQFFVPERSIETIISEIIIDDRLFISLNRFCRFKSIETNLFLWLNFYEENSLQCQYRLIGFSETNHLKVSRHNIARLLDKIKDIFSLVDSG